MKAMKNFTQMFIGFLLGFALSAVGFILYLLLRKDGPTLGDAERLEIVEIGFPGGDPIKQTGEINDMSEIKEGKKRRLKGLPKTAAGHAAAIEPGSARWTSTDESVVSVTPDPANELEADVVGVDGSENGSALIELRADGIRGEGVRELIATKSYVCTQGDAAVFEFEEGDETDVEPEPAPEGGSTAGGSETETIGSGDVGAMPAGIESTSENPDEQPVPGTLSGSSSGAGNEANQGVDANPSAGAGKGDAAGTTAPDESNQKPSDDAGPMTFDEAAADTAERNDDTPAGGDVDGSAVTERVGDHA